MSNQIHLLPLLPVWLICLVALVLFILLGWGCNILRTKQVPPTWIGILAVLRVAMVLVFVLCLLRPTMSYQRELTRRPPMLMLVDESQSMQHGDWFNTAKDAVSRASEAGELSDRFDLSWFSFGEQTEKRDSDSIETLEPNAPDTRLAEAIEAAWLAHRAATQSGDQAIGGELPRVLLVSDGNDLGRGDAIATARRLGAKVDVVLPPTQQAADATSYSIVNAQTPPRVLVGTEMRIGVTIRREGDGESTLPLKLTQDQRDVAEQSVRFEAGQTEARTYVTHRPQQAGLQRYELSLGNTSAEPYAVNVRVTEQRYELLYLEDRWRWSFKYLRRVLEDDPSFQLSAMLSRGQGSYVQFGEPDRRVNLGGYPQGSAEVEWFDMIVLGDVKVDGWPPQLASAIADGVTRQGKSLIVIAGPGLVDLATHPQLGPLLPVQVSQATANPINGPIQVRVTDEAQAASLFSTSPDSLLPPAATQLPPIDYIYPVMYKKPGATVLLEAVKHANAQGPLIVMAQQTVGRGQVLLIATDTLWKWQLDGPIDQAQQTLHSRFWQQALRALAPTQSTAGQQSIWVASDATRAAVGRDVLVDVRLDQPIPDAQLQVSVTVPDGKRTMLPLQPVEQPGSAEAGLVQRATLHLSAAGAHQVLAEVVRDGRTVSAGSLTIEGVARQQETAAKAPDRDALTALAQATGGELLDPSTPEYWYAQADAPLPQVIQQPVTVDLWHNFSLMLLLCVLLGADWMLRLIRGYV